MLNILSASAKLIAEEIEPTVKAWPIDVSMDHVLRWLLQFDSSDYHVAARIVRHLTVFGTKDIRTALEVAHTKLVRVAAQKPPGIQRGNTLYAGVGNASKSGGMVAYYYRLAADLPEGDFFTNDEEDDIDFANIHNIVLVDDVIGTGKTVTGEVKRIAEVVYPLPKTRSLYVLAVAGYEDGMQHVVDESGATVVAALEYSSFDTVASLDAAFYKGLRVEDRERLLKTVQRYCRAISKSELGFGNVGGLLVFEHNTPNTTLPIIWSSGKGWFPLFPRAVKIPGTAKVVKTAKEEKARQNNEPAPETSLARETIELTIFVEGKIEELFLDYCRTRLGLASSLNVKDVVAVALGGLHQSEKMIGVLRNARKHAILLLDDDEHTKRVMSMNRNLSEIPIVYMWPNTVALLDTERLMMDQTRFGALSDISAEPRTPAWFFEAERILFKRGSISSNTGRIVSIFDSYLDNAHYDRLVDALRRAIDKLFPAGQKE